MSSVIDSSALRMEMRRTVQRMSERGRKGRDKKGILSGCMHAHTLMYLTKETIGEKKRKRAIRTTRKSTAVGEEEAQHGQKAGQNAAGGGYERIRGQRGEE